MKREVPVRWEDGQVRAVNSQVWVDLQSATMEPYLMLSESKTRKLIQALQFSLAEVAKRNPHPGYDHEGAFCANCGY